MRRKLFLALLAMAATASPLESSLALSPSPSPEHFDFAAWLGGPARMLLVAEEIDIVNRIAGSDLEREFVDWFWRRRDPDPATLLNEFRVSFEDRVAFANRQFADPTGTMPGWATARGKIYVLMGPPEHVGRSSRPVFIAGALRRLTTWEYPHPKSSHRALRFSFVPTDSGVRLVAFGHRGTMSAEQIDCLETVRNDLVQSAEPGRFGAPVNLQQEPLPMQATLSQDGEGSLAKISLSLDDLLGELDNGAIRYRFALTSSSAGARRTVSHLGILEVRIDADDYRLWSEHRLHIVVWTPGPASEVSLTEVPTGRTGRVPLISRAQPDETVALGRKLAVAPLLGGRGVAIAYFPTCPERHPNAEAILVLAADATPRMADPLPGGRLALALPESSQ